MGTSYSKKPKKVIKLAPKRETFQNLSVLEKAQEALKLELGNTYEEKVAPFVNIIQMVMNANGVDKFTALKKIKDESDLYAKAKAPIFFSAAVMEIVESDHFVGFEK